MALSPGRQKMGLEDLENQPQKSLKTVHSILTASIRDLEQRLRDLQRSFYGAENGSTEELAKWSGVLRRVVDGTRVNGLFSVGQMEEILRVETSGRGAFPDDLPAIHRMMECCRKTEEAMARGEMPEILVEIGRVLVLTNKYCASFYNPDCDPFVGTAAAYENQRRRYINAVDDLVEKTHDLATKFRSSAKEGVRLVDLSAKSVDLSRRTGTAHAPFLLLFPEACENIRSALAALRSWIDDDRKFVGFVVSDVRDMDVRRTEAEKRVRGLRHAYHQLNFRRKQSREEAERRKLRLEKLRRCEDDLVVDEEFVSVEIKDIEADLDSTELKWSEWIRNGTGGGGGEGGGQPPEAGYYDKLNELADRIQALKAKLPTAKQRLSSLREKLKAVVDEQTRLRSEEKRGLQQEAEIADVSSRLAESEAESRGIAHALETARKIIVCKRSSDVVEKIFYEQQINRREPSKAKGYNDVFDKACAVVASRINKDWPVLYRVLPFHPPRGLATVDRDIHDLLNRETRGGKRQLARLALDRWRRYHTKAKVEDLEIALKVIRRSDIVQHMYSRVKPKEPVVVVESEIPDWLDVALVPYWREIERYDEIIAMGKGFKQKQIIKLNE